MRKSDLSPSLKKGRMTSYYPKRTKIFYGTKKIRTRTGLRQTVLVIQILYKKIQPRKEELEMRNSYFDGGLVTYIGTSILATLITVCTFGICAPWGICLLYNWKIKHTVINGKRLYFDGTAVQLFGNWIKWLFLTFITLGIYGFWLHIKLEQWRVKHTHVAG